jgi:hypothetical protein
MQYQLKSVMPVSKPETKRFTQTDANGNPVVIEKYGINICVTTSIVGQTYNGFCNNNAMFFELDKNDTENQSTVKMNAFATQYVATTYPNT